MCMDLPADLFLAPVQGDADIIAFRYGFGVKALEGNVVTETDNGDLIIEGYAAVFEGEDRQGENFAEGAFDRGVKSFIDGPAALCYHHKNDKCLGKVLELGIEEGKGLKMRARVDGAIRSHPELGTYYQQIKNGTLTALSIGGFFKRAATSVGQRIVDMDFTEISVTPVPMHTGPSFAVVAGKALVSDLKSEHVTIPEFPTNELRAADAASAQWAIDCLDRIFNSLNARGTGQSASTPVTY